MLKVLYGFFGIVSGFGLIVSNLKIVDSKMPDAVRFWLPLILILLYCVYVLFVPSYFC